MDWLSLRTLPYLTRRNYYFELLHILPWSVLAGLLEGQFCSIVVSKSFHAGPLLIAVAAATPVATQLFSITWGMLCVGRRKLRLLGVFAAGTALCAAAVGAIPPTKWGAIWFLIQVALAQILLSGVVTVRSAVWRANYPLSDRGRITARLQAARILANSITVLLAAKACDRDPESYRVVFLLAAALGAASLWFLPRIRIRRERREVARAQPDPEDTDLQRDLGEPYSLTALLSPGHIFERMYAILRDDWRYREYCIAQAFSGMANLMVLAVVVAIVTRGLPVGDDWGFWIATGLTQALERLAMLGSLRRWGRLFDRKGVLRFRVINVTCFSFALVFGLAATLVTLNGEQIGGAFLPMAVGLFAAYSILHGLGLGGGALAWNLGHLHFSHGDEAEVYMGIHVSLTGVRGLVAPLLGMWLYRTIGWPVWLISLTLSLSAVIMYRRLARLERHARDRATGAEPPKK